MTLTLNAFHISFDQAADITACEFPYEIESFLDLRDTHRETHTFYRIRDKVLCISADNNYPISCSLKTINAIENYGLTSLLIKERQNNTLY